MASLWCRPRSVSAIRVICASSAAGFCCRSLCVCSTPDSFSRTLLVHPIVYELLLRVAASQEPLLDDSTLFRPCLSRHASQSYSAEQCRVMLARVLSMVGAQRQSRAGRCAIFVLPSIGASPVDRVGSGRLIHLENNFVRLHTANAYVSTIGGGAFLMKFIGDAVRQALKQVAIARALGDVGLEARCHVHLAYCDVQVGRFRSAYRRLRLLHRIAGPRYLNDIVLVRMCDAGLRHARLTCQLWRSGALEMRPESDAAGAVLSLQEVAAAGAARAVSPSEADAAARACGGVPAASMGAEAGAAFAESEAAAAGGRIAAVAAGALSPACGAGAAADDASVASTSVGAAEAVAAVSAGGSSPASLSPCSPSASVRSPRVSGPGSGAAVIVPTHALASDDYRRIRLAKLDAPRLKENR